ncbi:MAG: hypothetical protein L3K26_09490 [Candidatus Hydrogenedentes bacterium]|nr:hypothetical protein [Candidatus Hydrogenedentota bacterium]
MSGNRFWRFALTLTGVLFLFLVAAFTLLNSRELASDELARRCAASRPAWNGYQEDVKEIGTRPVAQWRGHPTALTLSGGTVHLVFELGAPWDAWDAVLPVLLKTPEGQVLQNVRHERNGSSRTYVFFLSSASETPVPPWLEIQYPHTRQRLYLNAHGAWQAQIAES